MKFVYVLDRDMLTGLSVPGFVILLSCLICLFRDAFLRNICFTILILFPDAQYYAMLLLSLRLALMIILNPYIDEVCVCIGS